MYKIFLLSVGKNKEIWLEKALEEYVKRLSSYAIIEFVWAKDDFQLSHYCQKEGSVIALDPKGKMMTSEQFSHFLFKELEKRGSRLTLVIGGPEGLPEQIKKSSLLISLSPMTLTHQMTRLFLVEQIYRAFEIDRGSSYHK